MAFLAEHAITMVAQKADDETLTLFTGMIKLNLKLC
jgi:hypothetical protein